MAELAQSHAEEALTTLVAVMTDPGQTSPARIATATAIPDRGFGRPRQPAELTGPDGGPLTETPQLDVSRLSDAALREALAVMDARSGPIRERRLSRPVVPSVFRMAGGMAGMVQEPPEIPMK